MNHSDKAHMVFGDEAPKHLMGWRPDFVQVATKKCQQQFSFYDCDDQTTPPVPTPIWELTKQAGDGMHPPTFLQKTGDCVPASISQVGVHLQGAEISSLGQREILKLWNVPYIYGISRVQIGRSVIIGPGSTGAWGAAAVKQYGVLFADDTGVPPYSGRLSDEWGEPPGPGKNFQLLAANNLVRRIAPIVSVDDLRNALCNYYPITVASRQGFRMRPTKVFGYHVFVPEGIWYHQMALLAWMDYPFAAAYRLNSWGPDAHGLPLNGEPPGGAWCPAEILANELQEPGNEFFAYSRFDGFPSAVDRGILEEESDDQVIKRCHKEEQRDTAAQESCSWPG